MGQSPGLPPTPSSASVLQGGTREPPEIGFDLVARVRFGSIASAVRQPVEPKINQGPQTAPEELLPSRRDLRLGPRISTSARIAIHACRFRHACW